MRKIIVATFISLDGVMQAPGGPDEDRSGGFALGGWTAPYSDAVTGEAVNELVANPFDLLLARRTYDIFASHWPRISDDDPIARTFNAATKYVATHEPATLAWRGSEALGDDAPAALRALKAGDGPDLVVWGSSELVRLLFEHDLVDELRLWTFPLVLGAGKRLFDGSAKPAAFRLAASKVSGDGVVVSTYQRDGEVKTGSFALPD